MTHKIFIPFADNSRTTALSLPVTLQLEFSYEASFIHTTPCRPDGPFCLHEQRQRKRDTVQSQHVCLPRHAAHAKRFRSGSALRSAITTALHAAVSTPAKQRINTHTGRLRNFIAGLFVCASPAFADGQAIPPGTPLTAMQAAHAFDAGCLGTVPALIERQAALFQTAFFFGPAEMGTDAAYTSSNGAINVTIDGTPVKTVCQMSISSVIAGDGADLYDSVVVHLVERLGAEPQADYIDGGVVWNWQTGIATFTYAYTETEGAFLLTLTAES